VLAIDTVIAGGIYYSPGLAIQLAQPMAPDMLLTLRERQVLQHIAAGKANKQIAQVLDISVRTVETHRLNIKRKLNIESRLGDLTKDNVGQVHPLSVNANSCCRVAQAFESRHFPGPLHRQILC